MLKRHERKALFTKITVYVERKLNEFKLEKGWTDGEISMETGVSQSRLSELKNLERYGKVINKATLMRFLGAGILTVREIKKNIELTGKERDFLDEFMIFEQPRLIKAITMMEKDRQKHPEKLGTYELIKAYLEGRVKITKK